MHKYGLTLATLFIVAVGVLTWATLSNHVWSMLIACGTCAWIYVGMEKVAFNIPDITLDKD